MSKYSTLIAQIIANIRSNGAQAITGGLLQQQLLAMITSLGKYHQIGGLVLPSTEFTPSDEPVIFIATTPGTYTNFGGLVVADNEVAFLVWSGSAWSKQTLDIATKTEVSQLGQQVIYDVNIQTDVTPTLTQNMIKNKNIGETLELETRVNYRCAELSVNEGDLYFVSLYRVNGTTYSVFLVDSEEIIVSKLVPSTSETDYGVVENIPISIPAGVAKMYVMTYWNTTPQLLEIDKATEVKEAVKFSQNVAMYGAISVNKSTGVVSALSQLDIYCNGTFKRFNDGDNLFTITLSGSRAISYDIETQTLIYNNSEKCVVGICFGYNVFFNSRSVEVLYSDDTKDLNTLNLSKGLDDLQLQIINNLEVADKSDTTAIAGYTRYDTGERDDKVYLATRLIPNDSTYRYVKCKLGFDADNYYGAICFYNGTEQTTANYMQSKSVVGETGIKEYFVKIPDGCQLISVCNRPATLAEPEIYIYKAPEYQDISVLESEVTALQNERNNLTILPSQIYNEGYETWKRIISWADDDEIFMLGFLTDVHSGGNTFYKHIGYFNELNRLLGCDIFINNGDIGLDVGETDEQANQLLSNTKSRMDATAPWLFVKGNHERLIADAKLGCIFNRAFKNQFNDIVFGEPYGSYGYYDIEWHKIRVYFINTSDAEVGTHYGISQTQLQWFAASLLTVPSDYNIVVITHLCIEDCGRTTEETTMRTGVYDTFCDIMESFNQRTAGSGSSISWDYTSVTYSKIVCDLSGDSHFNNNSKVGDVNYIVRQGGGRGRMDIIPEGATKDEITGAVAFYDVLCVKNDGNAKIFRIGVGGSNRDLAFTY